MCPVGTELHQQYEIADRERTAAAGIADRGTTPNKQMVLAKQKYVETFANWLSHRAFCHDCKPGAPANQDRRFTLLDR